MRLRAEPKTQITHAVRQKKNLGKPFSAVLRDFFAFGIWGYSFAGFSGDCPEESLTESSGRSFRGSSSVFAAERGECASPSAGDFSPQAAWEGQVSLHPAHSVHPEHAVHPVRLPFFLPQAHAEQPIQPPRFFWRMRKTTAATNNAAMTPTKIQSPSFIRRDARCRSRVRRHTTR